MSEAKCIYGVGTGRSGGWLVTNIMSVHSKIMVFNERVHFFRFIYKRYDPLTPRSIERMVHDLRRRLSTRFNVVIEADPIIEAILRHDRLSYQVCYAEIMNWLLGTTDKQIWGEYAPIAWRNVPYFKKMFPAGKVFHIHRDPRAVLSSWAKMTFMPGHLYLNQIFNWIDSVNHIRRFREMYTDDEYLVIKYEDVHYHPEKTAHGFCDFLGVPFEEQLLQPERWPSLFDERYVEANVSSYTGKRVYGFNPQLTENWRKHLQPWQVALVEVLARDQMLYLGYEVSDKIDAAAFREGLDFLCREPFLLNNLNVLLSTKEGTDQLPTDPTEPSNWSAGEGGFDKFSETPEYQRYMADVDAVERLLDQKYGPVSEVLR